jgi:glycosyltransferase involved in cell wall biosynthesis
MRIAILHYTKPPVVGGVERVVGEQADALTALGHEVSLWNADEASAFRTRLNEHAFEAVLVHNVFTMPFNLAWTRELTDLTKQRTEVYWVNWVHDVAAVNPSYRSLGWNEPVPQALSVAVSQVRAGEWAAVAGLDEREVVVIPNGVDATKVLGLTERVVGLASERDLWGSELNLLQPARLVRRKNVEFGVAVMAAVKALGMRARLVVTGAPDPHQGDGKRYFDELQELVKESDLETEVVFAGAREALSDFDVRALYALCDGLFFPSRSEGFGLPLLEANLCRLPVWCSNLPVHREVVGGEVNWFEVDEKPSVLAERLTRWSRSDVGLRARRRVWMEYDWKALCKERLVPLLHAGIKRE